MVVFVPTEKAQTVLVVKETLSVTSDCNKLHVLAFTVKHCDLLYHVFIMFFATCSTYSH